MACCGCSVPFWSLRSSLSLRSGMRLWAVATAKRSSKARAMSTLYAVARTGHFAAFLSPFPPLHTAPCPPCPTAPRSLRSVHSTAYLPHTRCLRYSFYSCHAPINTEVRIFQYVENPPRTYANFSQHFAAFRQMTNPSTAQNGNNVLLKKPCKKREKIMNS